MSRVSRPPPRPVPAARPCVLCGPAPVGLSGKHKTFFTVPFTCRTLAFQTDKHTYDLSPKSSACSFPKFCLQERRGRGSGPHYTSPRVEGAVRAPRRVRGSFICA